ncbi:7116_t:CDS:1, partial [Funneliformis geosporum]
PNNKEEVKVEYAGINRITHDAYIFLLEGNKDHLYSISENHPCIKKLLNKNKLQKGKKFTIRYEKVDKKSDDGLLFTFNEDNKELEIIEV